MKFELRENNRNPSANLLLADLKRVASFLYKSSVTQADYKKHGRFHPDTVRKKFGSWFGALTEAGLERTRNLGITDDEFLGDLKRVSVQLGKDAITRAEYNHYGVYSASSCSRRFGTWFKALEKAALKKSRSYGVTNEQYFQNLEQMWIQLGRQPFYGEVQKPFSQFSSAACERRFGTWRKALERFIDHINGGSTSLKVDEVDAMRAAEVPSKTQPTLHKHKTKRTINDRLRVQVLIRDGNKCRICGRTVTGDDIHIDHIIAWTNDGETVLENLQVLCSRCNVGKSNL
jgi:hypothetical protein